MVDESHKLTTDAQNAFLKVLEDAPQHAYYIFCTSDPAKLIKAIHTRMTLFHFVNLQEIELVCLITAIAKAEEFELDDEDALLIAKYADGSARKAVVALEQVIAGGDVGKVVREVSLNLPKALLDEDQWGSICDYLKQIEQDNVEGLRHQICGYMTAVILNRKKADKVSNRAHTILAILASPCYNKYDLVRGCYQIMFCES